MKYKLQVHSIWEFGQRKDSEGNPHQEDSLFPAHGKATPEDRLFILCDGMGGHDAGEVASATICETMSKYILDAEPDPQGDFTDADLQGAISKAYDALDAKDTGAEKKMGSTMTLLKLFDAGATIAHIGDSRVYHIRPGADADSTKILFKTRDHSWVNDMVDLGELTEEQARTSSRKNVITRAMMPALERRYTASVYTTSDIRKGDYFYLCSDGMLEQMEDANICFIFSESGGDDLNKVHILTEATKYNRDNHTAIIVHITDVEGEPAPVSYRTDENTRPAPVHAEPAHSAANKDAEYPEKKTEDLNIGGAPKKPAFTREHLAWTICAVLCAVIVVLLVLLSRSGGNDAGKDMEPIEQQDGAQSDGTGTEGDKGTSAIDTEEEDGGTGIGLPKVSIPPKEDGKDGKKEGADGAEAPDKGENPWKSVKPIQLNK